MISAGLRELLVRAGNLSSPPEARTEAWHVWLTDTADEPVNLGRTHAATVTALWRAAGVDLVGLDGRTARECVADLHAANKALRAEPDMFEAMAPADDFTSAARFLLELEADFRAYPDGRVVVTREPMA